jgi:outer membrane biosynthesis protein TonB
VEFLVDEHGHARLPRVVDASAPEFGYAAVAAVALWTFEAPTAKGEPVVVRVRAPFIFK